MLVLVGEDGLGQIQLPVDSERRVDDGYAAVGLGTVAVVALVLEHGHVAQHGESVCETARDEELTVVVLGQKAAYMSAVCRRALTDVDGHVKHRASDAPHQLGLRVGRTLEMESAHHAPRRAGLVVLHEVDMPHGFVEHFLVETLEEISAGVGEHPRHEDDDSLYIGLDYLHIV